MALTPEQIERMRRVAGTPRSPVVQAPPPKEEKKTVSRGDGGFGPTKWLYDLFVKSVVETMAKPVGEVVASSYEAAGKDAPEWTKTRRLASPETIAGMESVVAGKGLAGTSRERIEELKAKGIGTGAGFVDVLNVASIAPAGAFAKAGKTVTTGLGSLKAGASPLATAGKAAWQGTKAGAGWGAAYGAAGKVDEGADAKDVAFGAGAGLVAGAGAGAALGLGSAAAGFAARKAGEAVSPALRQESARASNLKNLEKTVGKYSDLRKFEAKERKLGVLKAIADTDLLRNSVDDNGMIRTTQEGGAVDMMKRDVIGEANGIVTKKLKEEGKSVDLKDVAKRMKSSVKASDLEGEAYKRAEAAVNAEIDGLALRADADGRVPLWRVHKLKSQKMEGANYLDAEKDKIDKLFGTSLKEIVEDVSETNVKAANAELAKAYATLEFLLKLDGKRMEGGRAGRYMARIFGAIAGANGGPLGSMAGAEIADQAQKKVLRSAFGGLTGSEAPTLGAEVGKMRGWARPKPAGLLGPGAIITPPPKDTSGLLSQEAAAERMGIKKPKPAGLLGPGAIITPPPKDTSGLLSQEAAAERMGIKKPKPLALPTGQPGASGPAIPMRGATTFEPRAKSVRMAEIAQTARGSERPLGAKTKEELDDLISKRIEAFRDEAGMKADREGAGVRLRKVEDATGNVDFVAKDWSLNRAKGQMRRMAEGYKKEALGLLYENDAEFRRLVDQRDSILDDEIAAVSDFDDAMALFDDLERREKATKNAIETYAIEKKGGEPGGQGEKDR